MLNFYYAYSFTWGIVLSLYLLGWSGLNTALHPALLVFFLLTIMLSIWPGKLFSDRFIVKERNIPPLPTWAMLVILGCGAIGFVQMGYIPVTGFFDSTYDYSILINQEASIFRTIGIVGSVFGVNYQFYRLLNKKTRMDIIKLLLFVFYLLMMSSRGPFVICAITCFFLYCSCAHFKMTLSRGAVLIILLVTGLWLFGIFGNMRSGFEWNDSSYIFQLGHYDGYWPAILPKELCWAYSYLTSPLSNLNYAFTQDVMIDPVNFIYDFLPMMISKNLPLYNPVDAPLLVPYFNVSSVWSGYYQHLGVFGMFLGYFLQIIVMNVWHLCARDTDYEQLMLAYCMECTIMSFFVNSFVYPYMSYPAILLALICIVQKARNMQRPQDTVPVLARDKNGGPTLASPRGIGVVIVAFNRVDCLKKALEAFEVQTVPPAYILVVDNASTDGTGAYLDEWAADNGSICQRYVMHEEENKGGSGGFHDGLQRAQGLDAGWIWLSDDDAYPEPDCIEIASKWIADNDCSDVSAICGSVINQGRIDTGHRRIIEVKNMRVRENQIPAEEYADDFEINALSFVGAIIKKSVIREIGLPLESYFIWYDDTEYSLRLSEVGQVICIPGIRVNHDASKSDDYLTWKGYYGQRNLLDMIMRHYPKPVYLYSLLRARLKALRLRKMNPEIGEMYRAAIRDQKSGKSGIDDVYKPGWKAGDNLAHG